MPKDTYTKSVSVTAYITHVPKKYTLYKGTSTKTVTVSISALPLYTISYDGNPVIEGDTVTNLPPNQSKYHSKQITVSATIPEESNYAFIRWSDGNQTWSAGATYTKEGNNVLYAQWGAVDPPTCDVSQLALTIGDVDPQAQSSNNVIRGFTNVSCSVSDITVYHTEPPDNRELDYVQMEIAGVLSNKITSMEGGELFIYGVTDGEATFKDIPDGEYPVNIITRDTAGAEIPTEVGRVNIVTPAWSKRVVIDLPDPPQVDANGNAVLDELQVMDYTLDTPDYVSVSTKGLTLIEITERDGDEEIHKWAFDYVFNTNQVDDVLELNPNISIRVKYKHYEIVLKEGNRAFYSTTRNQNYSNGIYNVMFVGGVDSSAFPDYTSRSWWCRINDPLYFPETNYIEVGSNDTGIQGLTKVGDYLAVIKQSKTTDTAIFLIFPTSFEEETTYAVKQGVQGVGALSRYSFNILGDETLFLSPKGVMAIVPTQDEEHKVQNRSYFIDKRLLSETGIENAYSFVHDGKYFLSIGNGHCYVLDGNQRNSWGNDRTVLVYECYFLDNVPANCFVKYHDTLVFSNANDVCIFGDDYTDAYNGDDAEVPVKAEWSTIFDDDGSLHYYKTMQKKGNLISILPIENEQPYKQIEIDEETFNEDKTKYFVYKDDKYVRCTENSVYEFEFIETEVDEATFEDEATDKTAYWFIDDGVYVQCTPDSAYVEGRKYFFKTGVYFIENRSNTKVYVKKDDKPEVEIQRKFGLSSDVPSEMFFNKKFKKYKRLQFIVRNETDENFGIDSIVKNYTVGNYAKK